MTPTPEGNKTEEITTESSRDADLFGPLGPTISRPAWKLLIQCGAAFLIVRGKAK